MADLTITAASVVPGSGYSRSVGIAGEAITAGQAVYLDSTSGKWMKADANATGKKSVGGIALTGSSLNQPIVVLTAGDITIGATVEPGTAYCLSNTAGGICPQADLTTGDDVVVIGIGKSATVIAVDVQTPGVTL
jgi:hypothetical protein